MKATSKDGNQLELLAAEKEKPVFEPVTPAFIERIRMQRTFIDVWNYAQRLSALSDKAVCLKLGIDGSHWTKIGQGRASPPGDERFNRYLDVVKNEAPLIWWCEKRGYDFLSMRRHEDDKDREIAQLRAQLEQERHDREVEREYARQLQGRR